MNRFLAILMVCASSTFMWCAEVPAALKDVKRIVFLGDSITQGGSYVTDFECWLVAQGITNIEVISLGLGSETASDLTPEENDGHLKRHGFGRPFISERLDRILTATKPDLIFACYGMNDGGSLPPDAPGTARFAEAITRLRDAGLKAGAKKVVLCSPPVQDSKDSSKPGPHDQKLSNYTEWLLKKKAEGWDVVDIHGPMRKELDETRKANPKFTFSGDGVHPGREGHWLMAREILTQFLGAKLDGIDSAEKLFKTQGPELRKLVDERRTILANAWLTKTGHTRPGVAGGPKAKPGLPVEEATAKAAEIGKKIGTVLAL